MIKVSNTITIEPWEIIETFSISQGPGGQNVNKVSTAVELRFFASTSPNLTPVIKSKLKKEGNVRAFFPLELIVYDLSLIHI
mgnify:CR=1 FL=1